MRLIDRLAELGLAAAPAKRALASGKVFVDGVPSALATREVEPASVELRPNAPRTRVGIEAVVVHRDRGWVVVHKPAGLLSVPAPRRRGQLNVISQVRSALGSAFAVHRLDEATSGLMLVALDEPAQRRLKSELEAHRIDRRYLAIVSPPPPEGWEDTLRSTLVRDRGDGRRGSGGGPEAKFAVTHARALRRLSADLGLVEARLETGRTHQVRIHLAEAGYAIAGDPRYAPPAVRGRAPRLALHAYRLEVPDAQAVRKVFTAPLPDDLEAFLRRR
jgi:RluA family pseudouridine synthase